MAPHGHTDTLLAHKSIGLKSPTHGHQLSTGSVRHTEELIDRCQQVKHVTKSMLAYYKGLSSIETTSAKSTLALMDTIQVPFHEGHQFLGEGGWQQVLYDVRDSTKYLAGHHTALANTLDTVVITDLEAVRIKIKAQIAAIETEAKSVAEDLDKERTTSTTYLTQLQSGINIFENSQVQMTPQNDPCISHAIVAAQLEKQMLKENEFQAALIRFQQEQPAFEANMFKTIQMAAENFAEAHTRMVEDTAKVQAEIRAALARVEPDAEYKHYAAMEGSVLDPDTPYRLIEAITFPGHDHRSTVAIKTGPMERKHRLSKAYEESHYVLSPSGYLHALKTGDATPDLHPTFSLFLPECALGTPAKESDKSQKITIEGKKAVKSKGFFSFGSRKPDGHTFRARTHLEMNGWHAEMDKLARETKAAPVLNPITAPVHPVSYAVTNVGYAAAPTEDLLSSNAEASTSGAQSTESPELKVIPPTPTVAQESLTTEEVEAGSSEEEDEITTPTEEISSGGEHLPTYVGTGIAPVEKAALMEKGKARKKGKRGKTDIVA